MFLVLSAQHQILLLILSGTERIKELILRLKLQKTYDFLMILTLS